VSRSTHWNEGEIAQLSKLARDHTIAEISHRLGRSDSSVRRRLQVLGLTPKRSIRADLAEKGVDIKTRVGQLCDDGLPLRVIAERLNASLDYVTYCAGIHRGGAINGAGTMLRDPARERRHLIDIANASNSRGFPYCVAALPTAKAQICGQAVDECNNARRTIAQSRP
jgi:hypothetical protein